MICGQVSETALNNARYAIAYRAFFRSLRRVRVPGGTVYKNDPGAGFFYWQKLIICAFMLDNSTAFVYTYIIIEYPVPI